MTTFFLVMTVHFFVSLFIHSFFHHRYVTHGQCTMSPLWEKIFYLLAVVLQGPSFLSPRAYAKMHLQHHEHSDEKSDPHSPLNFWNRTTSYSILYAGTRMMIRTKQIFARIVDGTHEIALLYLEVHFPFWKTVEVIFNNTLVRILFGGLYILFYSLFITVWWEYFFIVLIILNGPIQGFIVNWFGHLWGLRNHNLDDNSRNTPVLNVLMLGELNQNNHHHDPSNPNFANKWHELDLTYCVMIVFALLGIIRFKKSSE